MPRCTIRIPPKIRDQPNLLLDCLTVVSDAKSRLDELAMDLPDLHAKIVQLKLRQGVLQGKLCKMD